MPWKKTFLLSESLPYVLVTLCCFQLHGRIERWFDMLYVQHVDWVLLHLVQITLVFEGSLCSCYCQLCVRCTTVLSSCLFQWPCFLQPGAIPRLSLRFGFSTKEPSQEPGTQRGSRQRGLMMRGGDFWPAVSTPPPSKHTHTCISV